jgi:Glycosyltransferases involved in cell wall biogenesis
VTPPLVSIIIPCYNAARWLGETLDSAFAQTWPNKEIILVDDGSTDESLAIARRYETRGLRLLAQPNRGASSARNNGLAAARGDFIQFLDADDLLAPDKLTRQLEMAARLGGESALCCRWTRFKRHINDADNTSQPLCKDADAIDWLITKFELHAMMHPAAWLVSRKLADLAGPWNENLSLDDDGEYFCRVVLASDRIRCCHDAMTFYRSNIAGSLSGSKSDAAWRSAWLSLELSTEKLLQAENSRRTRTACATALQRFIFEAYPHVPEYRAIAAAKVQSLGGSRLTPEGGPRFRIAARLLGWRLARRLERMLARNRTRGVPSREPRQPIH